MARLLKKMISMINSVEQVEDKALLHELKQVYNKYDRVTVDTAITHLQRELFLLTKYDDQELSKGVKYAIKLLKRWNNYGFDKI